MARKRELYLKNNKEIAEQKVVTSELAEYFYMHQTVVNRCLRKGIRLDYAYIVLNRKDLTRQEKKDYINNLSIDQKTKDNIWERFIGDKGFKYSTSQGLESEVNY